jgi:hypothetical protein
LRESREVARVRGKTADAGNIDRRYALFASILVT